LLLTAKPRQTMMNVRRPKMVLSGHLHMLAHLGIAQKQQARQVHISLTSTQYSKTKRRVPPSGFSPINCAIMIAIWVTKAIRRPKKMMKSHGQQMQS
jgi:hypothetical protein